MALFVKTTDGYLPTQWHIGGESLKDFVRPDVSVVAIMADGDELYKIQHDLDGIRKAQKQRTVTWTGEDATFIVENL